jgi:NAD(P)H-nitrite reductase large subunit
MILPAPVVLLWVRVAVLSLITFVVPITDVYAIGECALWEGKIYGLVAPGYQMADVACTHILGGEDKEFLAQT